MSSWRVFRRAARDLMDHELPKSQRDQIAEVLDQYSQIVRIDEVRTRSAGMKKFIYLFLQMDGQLTLAQAADLGQRIEADIRTRLGECEVIIHENPCDPGTPDAVASDPAAQA